jgi:hypothetical protein
MGTFNGAVLMGRVGTGGMQDVAKFLEESTDAWIVVEFPTLVQMHAFVLDLRGMGNKPLAEPVDGCPLGNADGAIKSARKMVLDHNEAGFTIESFAGGGARFVFGSLASEGEGDRQTLPRSGCFHHRRMAGRTFLELGRKAGRKLFKNWVVMLESRNTKDVLVSMTKAVVAAVGKALMPKKSVSTHGKLVQMKSAFNGGGGVIEVRGKRTQPGIKRSKRRTWTWISAIGLVRQEQRLGVTKSGIKNAMYDDVFRSSQGAVNSEGA